MLPVAPVVVAYPPTMRFWEMDWPVEEANTIVVSPVSPVVPVTVRLPSVAILVLMVLAAETTEAAMNNKERQSERATDFILPLVKSRKKLFITMLGYNY